MLPLSDPYGVHACTALCPTPPTQLRCSCHTCDRTLTCNIFRQLVQARQNGRNPSTVAIMEATVVCVDNSECTRNGDFEPNRFQAQSDAVNLLAGVKTGANRENTVGVLSSATLAGKTPKVMVTPTPDLAKVLSALSEITVEGGLDLCRSAQIAQLALKHRQNKNQRQRVVIFVGSTITETKASIIRSPQDSITTVYKSTYSVLG